MQTGEILTITLIICLLTPLIALILAKRKKRDYNFWILTCFLFPPAILFLALLPIKSKPPTKIFADEPHDDDNFFPNKD